MCPNSGCIGTYSMQSIEVSGTVLMAQYEYCIILIPYQYLSLWADLVVTLYTLNDLNWLWIEMRKQEVRTNTETGVLLGETSKPGRTDKNETKWNRVGRAKEGKVKECKKWRYRSRATVGWLQRCAADLLCLVSAAALTVAPTSPTDSEESAE